MDKYNYDKLKGLIKEHCGTQANYAKMLGISTTSLSQRLSSNQPFTQREIEMTKIKFKLTPKLVDEIFFTHIYG